MIRKVNEMTKKMTWSELRDATDPVVSCTIGNPMRAQYVLGAMEVMLVEMALSLPRHKQVEFAETLARLNARAVEITA
jgi:hypothetical protein